MPYLKLGAYGMAGSEADGKRVEQVMPAADVVICNRKGLHARASAKFVKLAETFNANVRVTRDGQTVGGTSIMGLMMLGASTGTKIHLEADGPQAHEALAALIALVVDGFGEDK